MDPATIMVLAASAVAAAVSYGVYHVRRQRLAYDARAEEVWARLGKNYDLTYTHAVVLDDRIVERQCSGTLTGLSVRVEQATSTVSNVRTTSVRVAVDGWPYPALEVRRHEKKGLARGTPTGDHVFDDLGFVRTEHPEFATSLVSPQVRAAFVDLWDFAGQADFADGKLVWRTPGVVGELKVLDGVLHRTLVAMRLLRAGTASLSDSGESMAGGPPRLYNPPQ